MIISTHALREEGDQAVHADALDARGFLPTPSARRATNNLQSGINSIQFLPTPSARRATSWASCLRWSTTVYFYPRPPRGGRHCNFCPAGSRRTISTHALREEGDLHIVLAVNASYGISTHALREEGDGLTDASASRGMLFLPTPSARRATLPCPAPAVPCSHFYPRPPRGGRLQALPGKGVPDRFLPTPSARRATRKRRLGRISGPISTHALREEGDSLTVISQSQQVISTHALREEGDPTKYSNVLPSAGTFLPTPSARRATHSSGYRQANRTIFLPTPSARRATW